MLLVILLAFGLRTTWPTLAEFKYDEANVVRHALQIAHEGALPVVGVDSSTGVKNLPLMLYLMALPLRYLPLRPALLHVVGIGMLYVLFFILERIARRGRPVS